MLYCSDWARSWSWWMERQVAPAESSRGQNGAQYFHDWGLGKAVAGLVMGNSEGESIGIWRAARRSHFGLDRPSLFPTAVSGGIGTDPRS